MIPIFEKFDSRSIYSNLLELTSHYPHMRTFAFLLYDSKDYLLHKILCDDDYWSSLNEISGQYLHIFYFDVSENRRSVERQKQEQRYRALQNLMEGASLQKMIPAPQPDDLNESIHMLKLLFQEKIKCPAILFLQVEDRSIVNHFVIELKKKEVEQAFIELHEIVSKAADHIKTYAEKGDYFTFLEERMKINKLFRFLKTRLSFKLGPFSCKL